MIEINLARIESEFRLKYTHKETGKEVRVKMVTRLDYVIWDPETKTRTPISRSRLIAEYDADKGNRKPTKRARLNFENPLTKRPA